MGSISEDRLPIFGEKQSHSAKHYFTSSRPPDQLKDLTEKIRKDTGITSKKDFCIFCVNHMDVDLLAQRSPSFEHFASQVKSWR